MPKHLVDDFFDSSIGTNFSRTQVLIEYLVVVWFLVFTLPSILGVFEMDRYLPFPEGVSTFVAVIVSHLRC